MILDVVYNHTAEGNQLGPTICFRGIDNASYYRLMPDNPRFYMDYTGTGNTLNARNPRTLQLIMDSLRYWILEMQVDGFRFDLASALARELHDVDRLGSFFDIIHQDPVISRVKLIAEPWDVGEGGYQVGNFPPLWSEWNGKYRDTVRDYWRGAQNTLGEFAFRFTGSSDLYEATGPPALRQHQLRHRPRRLHPARPRLLQREAQRGQRRGQPRRGEPQPLVEHGRRGADRRSRDQRAARAAEAQLPGHAAPVAGRAHAAARGTRSAAPSAATTTPTARTTRSPGSTGRARTASCCSSPAASSPCAATIPSSAAAAGSTGAPSTAAASPTSPGSRPTEGRWARTTGRRRTPSRSASS